MLDINRLVFLVCYFNYAINRIPTYVVTAADIDLM